MAKVILEQPSVHGMEREFVETFEFRRRWKALKLNDDNLRALQDMLCANPHAGNLIRGAGGVRKVRLELQGRVKSGGARVVCVDFAFDLGLREKRAGQPDCVAKEGDQRLREEPLTRLRELLWPRRTSISIAS